MSTPDPEFTAFASPLARRLAARGTVRAYTRGAVIIQEGDLGDGLYVILSGRVKVYVSDEDGREMVLDQHGPGDLVGEMSLDGQPRSASVAALEPVRCSVVTRAALREAIVEDPDLAFALINTLIDRARTATDTVKHLALMDVYGRVCRLLLSLAQPRPDGTMVVPERMTQQEVANRVGSSRDMVSRVVKDLVIGGYVSVADRVFTIHRRPPKRW